MLFLANLSIKVKLITTCYYSATIQKMNDITKWRRNYVDVKLKKIEIWLKKRFKWI